LPDAEWAHGDFDYNGFVDDDDITLLGVFYDPSAQPLVASPADPTALATTSVSAVPEPLGVSLLLAGAASLAVPMMIRSRRRRAPMRMRKSR
jgi:hypothetical protein